MMNVWGGTNFVTEAIEVEEVAPVSAVLSARSATETLKVTGKFR